MFSLLIQGMILPNPSLTLTDADLGSVASQAGSGHFRKNSNSLHVGTAGFQTTLLNVTGSLVVGVTTVFQCIGGIFKILLNIPRLGSSQQVDTAVSDSATSNKEQDFFSRCFVGGMFWWTSQLYPNGNEPMRIWAESPRKYIELYSLTWVGGSNKRDSCWWWSSALQSKARGSDLDYKTGRQPRQPVRP